LFFITFFILCILLLLVLIHHFPGDIAETLGGEFAQMLIVVNKQLQIYHVEVLEVSHDWLDQVLDAERDESEYFIQQLYVLRVDDLNGLGQDVDLEGAVDVVT